MKKWPAIYYASTADMEKKNLRQCNPNKATKLKTLGWRNFTPNMKTAKYVNDK